MKLKLPILMSFCLCAGCASVKQKPNMELLLTFDDFPCQKESNHKIQLEINLKILNTLKLHKTHGIVFVNTKPILEDHTKEREDILRLWLVNGNKAGNHTFSHLNLSDVSQLEYKLDIVNGEPVLKKILHEFNQELVYFRYPSFDYGKGEAKINIRMFLKSRGYEIVNATIDSRDWRFNTNMYHGDKKARTAYINFIKKALEENISKPPFLGDKHIVCFHVNRLTSDCLEEIITIAEKLGYKLSL